MTIGELKKFLNKYDNDLVVMLSTENSDETADIAFIQTEYDVEGETMVRLILAGA